jgi:crossover junction endodeoxyribonuclease RusA
MDRTETQNAAREICQGVGDPDPTWIEQTFLLPFPPSVNNLFSHNKTTGKRFISDNYKKWRTEAGWALKSQNPQKTSGQVRVRIIAVRPDKRRRDIDNITKAINDLLVQFEVIEDDCLIECQTVAWSSSDLSGVSVTVTGALKVKS